MSSGKNGLLGLTKDAWNSETFTPEHIYQATNEKCGLLLLLQQDSTQSTRGWIAMVKKAGRCCVTITLAHMGRCHLHQDSVACEFRCSLLNQVKFLTSGPGFQMVKNPIHLKWMLSHKKKPYYTHFSIHRWKFQCSSRKSPKFCFSVSSPRCFLTWQLLWYCWETEKAAIGIHVWVRSGEGNTSLIPHGSSLYSWKTHKGAHQERNNCLQ